MTNLFYLEQISKGMPSVNDKPFSHFGNLKIIQFVFMFHVLIGFKVLSVETSELWELRTVRIQASLFYHVSLIYANNSIAFHLHGCIYIFENTSPPLRKEESILIAGANCFTCTVSWQLCEE